MWYKARAVERRDGNYPGCAGKKRIVGEVVDMTLVLSDNHTQVDLHEVGGG
jgi:hypothetical protein